MDTQQFEINSTLTITVLKGDFGRYVKIQRKNRWIALSASLWKIVGEKMDNLRKTGFVLYLTKAKRLEVINFEEKRYVSLVEQKPGSDFKSYINFNDEEWTSLQAKMGDISAALIECDVCQNLKRPVVLLKDSKRVTESKLSKKKIAKIQEYNLTVQNQMGMRCQYCGQEMLDDCHCHAYDCYICEPQNFCSKCYSLTVYPAV